MSIAPIELTLQQDASSSVAGTISQKYIEESRFDDLRGVRWRINLGILPASSTSSSSYSSSIDDLRRVTADSRRRYAGLRRHLFVDPHVPKDGSSSPNIVMDNPLSQNPDSMWGRFFRSAELEKMVDQDLSRLYPEHDSYFQTQGCQAMLRRILLLWCLGHPENGYRQGMHELLAPLLYVLHVDVEHLAQVRKLYENHFADKFDELSFPDCNFDFRKFSESMENEIGSHKSPTKASSQDELDPKIKTIILLCDPYGAEGELGILLSEKFMEHDVYCMFDALMSGSHGVISMAEFFSSSPARGSLTGLPPVIEASSALYHLLSITDSSLYSHLVELGVEPQYFALRWLRVLFGREFTLENLLVIWDEIFASDDEKTVNREGNDSTLGFRILDTPRGAFISAMAVSMILHLRSSLLATETATSCLQRLLNFPENINLTKLIEKAKTLQSIALCADMSSSSNQYSLVWAHDWSKSKVLRGHSLSVDSSSPKTPLNVVPDSYWEGKWRDLHKEEELQKQNPGKQIPTRKKGWTEKVKSSITRTESDPSPTKAQSSQKEPKLQVRRSLLEDLSRELGYQDDEILGQKETKVEKIDGSGHNGNFSSTVEERLLNENSGSGENSPIFSSPTSSIDGANDHDNETEKSSLSSNFSVNEKEDENGNIESLQNICHDSESPHSISNPPGDISINSESNHDAFGKPNASLKERKLLSGKFPWFWKFGRNSGEGTSEKEGNPEAVRVVPIDGGSNNQNKKINSSSSSCSSPSTAEGNHNFLATGKGESVEENLIISLKNLGQSMLENIQVIESVFQQDRGQVGALENLSKLMLVGKGQVTAVAALKELRRISNLLSEM